MPKSPTNPFRYGKLVQKDNFCSRPELKTLKHYLQAGQNVTLYGERRIGKTSLVEETIRSMRSYRSLYIDIYEIQSIHSLSQRIASAITKKGNQSLVQQFVKAVNSLRPKLSFNNDGMPTIGFDVEALSTPTDLEPLIDFLCENFSSTNRVIVFDEFQSILNLKESREIQAILRSKIQQSEGAFVFLGSMRNEMHLLFTGQNSPFKDSALLMEIEYLPLDRFQKFLAGKFKSTGYTVDTTVWEDIFAITRGQPNETQKLCSALWIAHIDSRTITNDSLKAGYELVFAMQQAQFERDWAFLTDIQQRALRNIATNSGKNVTARAFLQSSGIAHGPTVKRSINRLLELELIMKWKKEYVFTDPFFRLWLLTKGY